MEPRFGQDLSQVRVHTGEAAAESVRATNALAYTVGRHVVFGRGSYEPWTERGRRLLAHELAHVIQQGRAADPSGELRVSDQHGPGEIEAWRAADEAVTGALVGRVQRMGVTIARANGAVAAPGPAPGPGGNRCLEILGEILSFLYGGAQHVVDGIVLGGPDIHRGLIERYEHMREDPHKLYRDHPTQARRHPAYGSWEGHQGQYRDMARGLRDRLNDWARNNCDDPDSGVPEGARVHVPRAWDYATREPPVQPALVEAAPARRGIDPEKVLTVLKILGVSLLLLGLVIAALLDPEPLTKLGLLGLSAATATLLLVMLGLREDGAAPTSPGGPAVAAAEPFPEEEEALA
jgi:hypothetical protein